MNTGDDRRQVQEKHESARKDIVIFFQKLIGGRSCAFLIKGYAQSPFPAFSAVVQANILDTDSSGCHDSRDNGDGARLVHNVDGE